MESHDEYVASATLMILGYDLDPTKITQLLGMHPSQSWRAGEEKKLARGSFYEWGGWKCFGEKSNDSLELKIKSWLARLEGLQQEFSQINSFGWRCSLDCFLAFDSVTSLRLSQDLILKASEFSLEIDICLNN